MTDPRIDRAQFLQRAAALGLLATAATTATTTSAVSAPSARASTASAVRRTLEFKGVAYDTGTGFVGDDSRMRWRKSIMRGFTARMVKVARSNFKGRITYGAASDLEQVDWSLIDGLAVHLGTEGVLPCGVPVLLHPLRSLASEDSDVRSTGPVPLTTSRGGRSEPMAERNCVGWLRW
jgi:hypothetical protein